MSIESKPIYKNKYALMASLAVIGAVSGYAYWYYIGCMSGSCLITSRWHNSTLYGIVMGGLIGSSVSDFVNKKAK